MMGLSRVVEEEECRDSWRDGSVKSAPDGRFPRVGSCYMWSRHLDKQFGRHVRFCREWKVFGAASLSVIEDTFQLLPVKALLQILKCLWNLI
jgi:hypothetical protein